MSCAVTVFFFFQAEDGIRDYKVTGVQTCALPIWIPPADWPPKTPSDCWRSNRWSKRCRSEEHTSEFQSPCNLVCRLLLEKKKKKTNTHTLSYRNYTQSYTA